MSSDKTLRIIIRPKDGDWIMGEDWEVEVPENTTIVGLKKFIETHKGISSYRQTIRLQTLKLVPTNREVWSLRRLGFNNGHMVYVEPTNPSRGWYWMPMQYYHEKLLREVAEKITEAGGRVSCRKLAETVKVPPAMPYSLQVFLRMYPDRIFMRTDITSGEYWLHNADPRGYQLPTFETYPIDIGDSKPNSQYDLTREFDWAAYKDVDDTKPLVSGVTVPDIAYEFSLVAASNLYVPDPFQPSTVYAILYFNGTEKARAPFRKNTTYPKWNGDARFRIAIPPSVELNTCTILVEFYDLDAVENVFQNPLNRGRFLGCLDLSEQAMPELFRNRSVQQQTYPLTPRRKTKAKKIILQLTMAEIEAGKVPGGGDSDSEDEDTDDDDEEEEAGEEVEEGKEKDEKALAAAAFEAERLKRKKQAAKKKKKKPTKPAFIEVPPEGGGEPIITGTVTVMAGPASYELCVEGARGIVRVPDEKSQPMAVVVWNRNDIFTTSKGEAVNPRWDSEPVQMTVPGTKTLAECELEVQLWASVPVSPAQQAAAAAAASAPAEGDHSRKKGAKGGKKKKGEDRGDFMGSVCFMGQELVELLRFSPDGDGYEAAAKKPAGAAAAGEGADGEGEGEGGGEGAHDEEAALKKSFGPNEKWIWAQRIVNRTLVKSVHIQAAEKLKPVRGTINLTAGYPGLYKFPGRRYAITMVSCGKIGKVKGIGCMVFWNYKKLGITGRAPVTTEEVIIDNGDGTTKTLFDNTANFILPTDYVGTKASSTFYLDTVIDATRATRNFSHVAGCHLELEFYEMGTQGSVGNFIGSTAIEGEALKDLLESTAPFDEPPEEEEGENAPSSGFSLKTSSSSKAAEAANAKAAAIAAKMKPPPSNGMVVVEREFDLGPDPRNDKGNKNLSGKLVVWGGLADGRKAYERIIIVSGIKNLPKPAPVDPAEAAAAATGGRPSSAAFGGRPTSAGRPSSALGRPTSAASRGSEEESGARAAPPPTGAFAQVIVKYNRKIIAKSKICPNSCNPALDRFYISVPYITPIPDSDAKLIGTMLSDKEAKAKAEEEKKNKFAAISKAIAAKFNAVMGKKEVVEPDRLEFEVWDTDPTTGTLSRPINTLTFTGPEVLELLGQGEDEYREKVYTCPALNATTLTSMQATKDAVVAAAAAQGGPGSRASMIGGKGGAAAAGAAPSSITGRASVIGSLLNKRSSAVNAATGGVRIAPVQLKIASLGVLHDTPATYEAQLHKVADDFRKKLAVRAANFSAAGAAEVNDYDG